MSKERDAMRAMLEWVDNNADLVTTAFRACEDEFSRQAETARRMPDSTHTLNGQAPSAIALMCHQQSASWRKHRETFVALFESLPDREMF